jgi:hypothetical protein
MRMIAGTKSTLARSEEIVRNALQFVASLDEAGQACPAVSLWMDLLGFRGHLNTKNWDLNEEATQLGMKRIAVLHEVAVQSMNDRYEIVHLNDAVVIGQDIPADGSAHLLGEFLALADLCFELAVLSDREVGGFGVRGVIARGKRYGLRANLGWTQEGALDSRRPSFFSPRPIMMNTAFGRAYGVESSRELLKASSLYVEIPLIYDYGAPIMETWNIDERVEVTGFGDFALVRS